MKDQLKEILKLDTKSDEFFEIYEAISDKYWTFENPTIEQSASKTLVMFAERFDSDKVFLCTKLAMEIINMANKKSKSAKGHIVYSNCEYFFDIYENENSKDGLSNILSKIYNKIENGDVEIKGMVE